MRLATIDVGTNTAKMLVAEGAGTGFRSLYEERRFVRLGEGVDRHGAIGAEAVARLVAALTHFRDVAATYDVAPERVVVGATSASRDARNLADVAAHVYDATGLTYRAITGAEEAALSFLGATSAWPDLAGPVAVVDIGGGSTEVVGGVVGTSHFSFRVSLNVGSVRVTERCFTAQPAPPPEREAAAQLVQSTLAQAGLPRDPDRLLVGAAGTTGALARMHFGFGAWREVEGQALTMTRAEVHGWRERLATLTFDETLALNPRVMHGRADIFHAGLVVLDETMEALGAPALRISPRGLRHGLALRAFQQP